MFKGSFNRLPLNRTNENRLTIETVPLNATAGIYTNANTEQITPPSIGANIGIYQGSINLSVIVPGNVISASTQVSTGNVSTRVTNFYATLYPLKANAFHSGVYGGPGGPEQPGDPPPPDAPQIVVKDSPLEPPYDFGPGSWEWPRAGRDLQNTGRTKGKTLYNPRPIWYEMGYSWEDFGIHGNAMYGYINGGPIIDEEGTIYTFLERNINDIVFRMLAVRRDGTVKFRRDYTTAESGCSMGSYFWFMTPTYHNGHVYVGMTDNILWKISTVTGDIVWFKQIANPEGTINTFPLIMNDGTILISSTELIALNSDGTEKWRRRAGPHTNDTYDQHAVSIGPISGRIYCTTSGLDHLRWTDPTAPTTINYLCALHCIDPTDGTLIWERPAPYVSYWSVSQQKERWDAPRWCSKNSAPTITSNELILVSDGRGGWPSAINADGHIVWTTDLYTATGRWYSCITNSTLSHDETVFNIIGFYGTYVSLDVQTGGIINHFAYTGKCEIIPLIDGDDYTYFCAYNYEGITTSRYVTRIYKVDKLGNVSKVFYFGDVEHPDNILKPIPEGTHWEAMQNECFLTGICLDYNGRLYVLDIDWGAIMAIDFGLLQTYSHAKPLVSAHTNAMIQYVRHL